MFRFYKKAPGESGGTDGFPIWGPQGGSPTWWLLRYPPNVKATNRKFPNLMETPKPKHLILAMQALHYWVSELPALCRHQSLVSELPALNSNIRATEEMDHAEGRPHVRQGESYLRDMGMADPASAWAMAKWRSKEYRRKVDAATRYSGVYPHT